MKRFLIILAFIFLTACTSARYDYYPENYKNSDISISASLIKILDENSPLNYIRIYDLRNNYRNREKEPYYNVKVLSSIVKIISNGKEYVINTKPDSDHIYVYKQGVIITGDFMAYIGKIQLDNGKIIDIPPLKFKKHIYVEKYNAVSDALNKGAQTKEIFSGTVEDYKKQKK